MLLFSTRSQEKKSESNYQNRIKRVGIYGGTFNPIHIAHLIVAETVREELELDEIWFMPANIPPHKQNQSILASEHRLRMVQLAIAPYDNFKVCTYELDQPTVSYTFDTISALQKIYPDHEFYFIIGGDMVAYLPNWYRYEQLLTMIQFVAVKRPQHPFSFDQPWIKNIHIVDMPQMDISSSYIRKRCKENRSIRFLVPDVVDQYIKEHQLYVE